MYVARKGTRFIPHDSNVAPSPRGCTSRCHRYDECRFGDAHHTQGARIRPIRGSSRRAVMPSASEDARHALMRAPQYPRGTSTRVSTRFIPPGSNATLLPLGGTVTRALCARCRSSGSVVPRVMRPSRASTRRHGVGSNATLPVSETASCSLVGRSAEVRRGNSPVWPNHSLNTSEDIYTSIAFIDMIHRSVAQYVDGRTDLHAVTASVAL